MARQTVSTILQQIASTVNQEASAPTTGGDEFNLWMDYLNRAQDEWAVAHEWESSRIHFYPGITGVSQASITLPADFKQLAGPVLLYHPSRQNPYEYQYMIDEQEQIFESTDLYVRLTGDNSTGKTLLINPGTLASGASLYIPYFSYPTSLSTTTQYLPMSDPQFAVDKTISYIFEARSDPRFQIIEQRAAERLAVMIENENSEKFSSYAAVSYIPSTLRRSGFRIGRN